MKIANRVIYHTNGDGAYAGHTVVYVTRNGYVSFVFFREDKPVFVKSYEEYEARQILQVLKEIFSE